MERPAADVERIRVHGGHVLQQVPRQAAQQTSDEDHEWQSRLRMADRLSERLRRERRVGLKPRVTGGAGRMGGGDQGAEVGEFRDDAVNGQRHACPSSLTAAVGSIVRISKIEITGRKRMKRYSSVTNSPIDPRN